MRIFKIIFWIVIIGLFGLIVYQDQSFFLMRHKLAVHFGDTAYQTMELPIVVFFAFFFLLGWLIAYLFGLLERYKVGRNNKQLRQAAESNQESLDQLKKQVDILKAGIRTPDDVPSQPAAETPEPVAETSQQP